MDTVPTDFKPPYMSFQTFWSFLADLSSKPLPPKLDRSIMTNKSGTDQNNLMAALEAFGFIDSDGRVEDDLQAFAAADADGRKEVLRTIVNVFYESPLKWSAANGTPANLNEAFRDDLGMAASDTRRKAITFFLHAAREAEIELSPSFPKTRTGSGSPGAPKAKRSTTRKKPDQGTPLTPSTSTPGHSQTVTLQSGGTVTLTYNVNMFEVTDGDESFVLDLIKKLRSYKSAHTTTAEDETEGGAS